MKITFGRYSREKVSVSICLQILVSSKRLVLNRVIISFIPKYKGTVSVWLINLGADHGLLNSFSTKACISPKKHLTAQTRIGATGVAVSVWDIEKMWPLFTLSLKGKHCTTPNLREWFPLSNKCPSILLSIRVTPPPPYWILATKKIIAKYILLR